MAEKKFIAICLVCIILVTGLVGVTMLLNQKEDEIKIKTEQFIEMEDQKNSLETQLASSQTENSMLNSEVDSLESHVLDLETEKSLLENEKTTLETEVSSLQNEKSGLEMQVSGLESEVSGLEDDVAVLGAQVLSLQGDISDLQDEVVEKYNLGYSEGEFVGYETGYDLGYDEGYSSGVKFMTENGVYLVDPTYYEALAFINSDNTNLNPYTQYYVCYDFTADFIGNALQAGYRCGFVYIEFSDSAHAIACFDTTDNGLIYVEPQTDEIVSVAVGQQYSGYTIVDMGIIW